LDGIGLHNIDAVVTDVARRQAVVVEYVVWRKFLSDEQDDRRFGKERAMYEGKARLGGDESRDRLEFVEVIVDYCLDATPLSGGEDSHNLHPARRSVRA
jgi:hypothetical protein